MLSIGEIESGVESEREYDFPHQQAEERLQRLTFQAEKQQVSLYKVLEAVSTQSDQNLHQTLYITKVYLTKIAKNNSKQKQLLSGIDFIDLMKQALQTKCQKAIFEGFSLLYKSACYLFRDSPLKVRIFEDNFALIMRVVVAVVAIQKRTAIQRIIRLIAYLLDKNIETLKVLFEENLLLKLQKLLATTKSGNAHSAFAQLIQKILANDYTLNEQQAVSVLSVILQCIEGSHKQKMAAKQLIQLLINFFDTKKPEYVPKLNSQITIILKAFMPFSAQFVRLLFWAVEKYGLKDIFAQELTQNLTFLLGNQDPSLYTHITNIVIYFCKNAELISATCLSQLRKLLSKLISRKIPESYECLTKFINLCMQMIERRNLLIEQAQFPAIFQQLAYIYSFKQPKISKKNVAGWVILESDANVAARLSVNDKKKLIRQWFSVFGLQLVVKLIKKYCKE